MTEINEVTETTASEFKKKLSKVLKKHDSTNIEMDNLLELIKKIKITKKPRVKRDLTSYNIFMKESMKQVKIDNPLFRRQDVLKESARLWKLEKED